MAIEKWKYYNYAVIPTTAPHEEPDLTPIIDGSIWKISEGTPYLARWTTDFDCGYETEWWYCIKDTPFDIFALPSKKRYEINKGLKNFDVKVIAPSEYKDDLYEITVDAYSSWSNKYRPSVDEDKFKTSIDVWKDPIVVLGAFLKETGVLSGYAYLTEEYGYVNFNVMRTKPNCEKRGINAALVAGVCEYYSERLSDGNGFYICDGSRNILHKTSFQNYLEKYFGFRKAYCRLNLLYRKPFGTIVSLLMPFRKCLLKLDGFTVVSKINGILRMEEIGRSQTNPEE